jgi:hypothetical protein
MDDPHFNEIAKLKNKKPWFLWTIAILAFKKPLERNSSSNDEATS